MTITYINLVGSYEHFDLTVKYHLEGNWVSGNTNSETPVFYSATGTNVSHSWPRTFGTNEIHCNEDIMQIPIPEETINGNTYQGMKSIVYIDVFARDANLLKLFCLEINRIVWELSPNSATRLKKSNGTQNSPISRFDRNTLQFKKERLMEPNMKLQPHASTEIGIIWHKLKT